MKGKVCIVTGGTSGLGRGLAHALAAREATVVLVARDASRGESVVKKIARATGSAQVSYLQADLSSMASVRRLAAEVQGRHQSLHLMVNNAAVFKPRRVLNDSGLELMFATNHLGPFLLTNLLLDLLKRSAPATVVSVTAPATTHLDFDDLQGEHLFRPGRAFGMSKTANLLFTFALARRLQGTGVTAFAYFPGLVRTRLMREAPFPMSVMSNIINLFAASPARAGERLAALVADPPADASGRLLTSGKPVQASEYTQDQAVQEQLWEVSAKLAGIG